ncbi:hypothetical protein [Pyramidobacter piscolens]|nr:hypothetical protein [Pyramidobacter piscolens]
MTEILNKARPKKNYKASGQTVQRSGMFERRDSRERSAHFINAFYQE